MSKLCTYTVMIAICLGTTAVLAVSNHTVQPRTSAEARFAADGAFRDGLYLGRLTAQRGAPMHIACGRWATAADRGLFVAGFQQGYHELQASAFARTRQAQ